jgi:hypothetical protein
MRELEPSARAGSRCRKSEREHNADWARRVAEGASARGAAGLSGKPMLGDAARERGEFARAEMTCVWTDALWLILSAPGIAADIKQHDVQAGSSEERCERRLRDAVREC